MRTDAWHYVAIVRSGGQAVCPSTEVGTNYPAYPPSQFIGDSSEPLNVMNMTEKCHPVIIPNGLSTAVNPYASENLPYALRGAATGYHADMQCNIDAKGKALRLISGLVVTTIGLILLALAAVGMVGGTWPWVAAVVILVCGAFQLFEAWAGWCVVRAMGFKTRI